MLINTILDTEDFVHLYYPEDDVPNSSQGCGAGARMASKYQNRSSTPEYTEVNPPSYAMCSRPVRVGSVASDPQPAAAPVAALASTPRRVRACDAYPRARMHSDEPDLSVPFAPICGEFVQYIGRTSDGATLALSNYRLHAGGVGVPVRLIDSCEIKELLYLHIQCKDGRSIKCTFNSNSSCAEWCRRLCAAIAPASGLSDTFAAAYRAWALEAPSVSPARRLLAYDAPAPYQRFRREVERLGFLTHGAWRVTEANVSYKLCPSYPPYVIVPASVGDEDLDSVARFRAARRIPAVVWRHRGNGAVLARSSQPEVGWLGWRSSEDERLLAALSATCALDRAAHNKARLLIVDARSYTSAVTNRARGGGCECPQYYPGADIQFMCLPNIHNVRKSFQQLRQLAAEPSDIPNWHSSLERTLWLQYISGLGRTAGVVARALLAARPVLVHCSDGWDRTPQVTAAAQLLLDPYYRTLEGFRVLIEREWLDFGHKFADRCGHTFGPEEPNERSPIFIQWLDLVHQIMKQYPCSFEFTEAYLIKLVTHAHSCMFGTFLCNNPCERRDNDVAEKTCSVWPLLESPVYRNHLYCPPQHAEVLWPEYSVRSLQFWWSLYVGDKVDGDVTEAMPTTNGHPPPHINSNGLLSKTRSCDNLAIDADKKSTQRRCSDPNLCPDLVVSLAIGRDDSSERTDFSTSGSDLTAASGRNDDQVDGISIFENGLNGVTRDITSNSSSLERELAGAAVSVNGANGDVKMANSQAHMANGKVNVGEVCINNNATGSSDENGVFFEDSCFAELNLNREDIGRSRHISITWRSVSESSHHTDSSAGFDLGDITNHNSILNRERDAEERSDDITMGMEERTEMTPTLSGTVNDDTEPDSHANLESNGSVEGLDEAQTVVLQANSECSTRTHSEDGTQVESECSTRAQSELESEKREESSTPDMESATRESSVENGLTNGINHAKLDEAAVKLLEVELGNLELNGSATTNRSDDRMWWSEHTLCGFKSGNGSNGATTVDGSGAFGACDADGLPVAHNPVQKRLHQMCMQHKALVEDLQNALSAALKARIPSPDPHQGVLTPQDPLDIEIEMGVEAGATWNSESARCQGCRNQFWFVRRKHHCRSCGGAFCSSCSWSGGDGRVCRACTARR